MIDKLWCLLFSHKERKIDGHFVDTELGKYFVKEYWICSRCNSILKFEEKRNEH